MKKLLLLLLFLSLCLGTPAQQRRGNRRQPTKREQLQADRDKLKREREANQRKRKELEEKVKKNLQEVESLAQEIEDRRLVVDSIRCGIDTLNANIAVLDSQLTQLKRELEERRQHYVQSVRYMYRSRQGRRQLMFVLSADNINQMYRRMRFMKEYTTYQKAQGEAVKQKSEQVDQKHQELTAAREQMQVLLARGEQEQHALEGKQTAQQQLIDQLQKEKQTVQKLISQQQKQEAELNAKIDRLIAEEIERARKAEEERQRKLAEERRKRNTNAEPAAPAFNPAAVDKQLSGSFASNKGRLPVPITGDYQLVRGFGPYTIEGVSLDSKGIHLKGKPGAQARCVFDGEVSRVYHPDNTYIVMVRHGRYISVYCNLSSVSVTTGQKVKTNQTLGPVGPGLVLQFRLQNWTELLNPKPWLSRLR